MTKCGKCEGAYFKIEEISPNGARYKFYAVQCTRCQTPIGVTDYYNLGSLLKGQEEEISKIQSQLGNLAHTVDQIADALDRMARR
jgi:hypothetical protein